jgi:hypothetical protein
MNQMICSIQFLIFATSSHNGYVYVDRYAEEQRNRSIKLTVRCVSVLQNIVPCKSE